MWQATLPISLRRGPCSCDELRPEIDFGAHVELCANGIAGSAGDVDRRVIDQANGWRLAVYDRADGSCEVAVAVHTAAAVVWNADGEGVSITDLVLGGRCSYQVRVQRQRPASMAAAGQDGTEEALLWLDSSEGIQLASPLHSCAVASAREAVCVGGRGMSNFGSILEASQLAPWVPASDLLGRHVAPAECHWEDAECVTP